MEINKKEAVSTEGKVEVTVTDEAVANETATAEMTAVDTEVAIETATNEQKVEKAVHEVPDELKNVIEAGRKGVSNKQMINPMKKAIDGLSFPKLRANPMS